MRLFRYKYQLQEHKLRVDNSHNTRQNTRLYFQESILSFRRTTEQRGSYLEPVRVSFFEISLLNLRL